uniref:Phosphatase and actin regulator n=1 Tax=Gasterosteus aculeatus aculeatus TaxID=481459 RepID=A0AAQ4QDF8_GASAC
MVQRDMTVTSVLQLKLQQRRTREELVSQGIMPPLKSPAAFHEQRRSLERARTEDYLKRKIRSRPERSELVRMHILEDVGRAVPAGQAAATEASAAGRRPQRQDLPPAGPHRTGSQEHPVGRLPRELARRFPEGRQLVFRRGQQRRSVTGPANQSRLPPECRPPAVPF